MACNIATHPAARKSGSGPSICSVVWMLAGTLSVCSRSGSSRATMQIRSVKTGAPPRGRVVDQQDQRVQPSVGCLCGTLSSFAGEDAEEGRSVGETVTAAAARVSAMAGSITLLSRRRAGKVIGPSSSVAYRRQQRRNAVPASAQRGVEVRCRCVRIPRRPRWRPMCAPAMIGAVIGPEPRRQMRRPRIAVW